MGESRTIDEDAPTDPAACLSDGGCLADVGHVTPNCATRAFVRLSFVRLLTAVPLAARLRVDTSYDLTSYAYGVLRVFASSPLLLEVERRRLGDIASTKSDRTY